LLNYVENLFIFVMKFKALVIVFVVIVLSAVIAAAFFSSYRRAGYADEKAQTDGLPTYELKQIAPFETQPKVGDKFIIAVSVHLPTKYSSQAMPVSAPHTLGTALANGRLALAYDVTTLNLEGVAGNVPPEVAITPSIKTANLKIDNNLGRMSVDLLLNDGTQFRSDETFIYLEFSLKAIPSYTRIIVDSATSVLGQPSLLPKKVGLMGHEVMLSNNVCRAIAEPSCAEGSSATVVSRDKNGCVQEYKCIAGTAIANCPTHPFPAPDSCAKGKLISMGVDDTGCSLQIACQLAPEPEVEKACDLSAKVCPDGSVVGRDFKNNCEFRKCPGE
jgi:hypothetical protein